MSLRIIKGNNPSTILFYNELHKNEYSLDCIQWRKIPLIPNFKLFIHDKNSNTQMCSSSNCLQFQANIVL